MAIEHVDITDPDIHEPKGISAASANEVYVADGLGSGAWGGVPLNLVVSVATFTSSGTWNKPEGLVYVKVTCVGGGGGTPSANGASSGGAGGTSSFGSHCSASGGGGGSAGASGSGGVGSGGNINLGGATGVTGWPRALPGILLYPFGTGADTGNLGAGGGGGASIKYIQAGDLANSVTVTVGNGGSAGGVGGSPGSGGIVIVEQYIQG